MRFILIILILYSITSANDNYKLKLYETVLTALFKSKHIYVYSDEKGRKIIQGSNKLIFTNHCGDADLLLGKNLQEAKEKCPDKPVFATSYRTFKNSKNSFGAYYWTKGRPQIILNAYVIKRYSLSVPENMKRYLQ